MPGSRCQPANGWFVLVAGWPGSGKSTLAAALAAELGLPLLAKDKIKEAPVEGLGRPETAAASQRLGRAAVLAMLSTARTCPGAVLDSTWVRLCAPASAHAFPAGSSRCTAPLRWTGPAPPTVVPATLMVPAATKSCGVNHRARPGSVLLSCSIPPVRQTLASSPPPRPKCSAPPELRQSRPRQAKSATAD
jgi:hypothetical protein